MSRRPARCTEAELKRAVKAADGKLAVEVLPNGTIRLTPIRPQESAIVPAEEREPMVF